MEAPTFLTTALHRNWAYHVFKHLTPHDAGRLELCLGSALVFTAPAVTPLMRLIAGRMHADAEEVGATMLFPLDAERGGRRTWAAELLQVYAALARLAMRGEKKMISAGSEQTMMASRNGKTWKTGYSQRNEAHSLSSFGMSMSERRACEIAPHMHSGNIHVEPRLIMASVAVKQVVATPSNHSMVLTSSGKVYSWTMDVPTQVQRLACVAYIAAGARHCLAVGKECVVYAWGSNDAGQLGLVHGTGHTVLTPREVPDLNGAVAVAAGSDHSFVLNRDGTVVACGWNSGGQLGLGDNVQRDTFTVVAGLLRVVDLDAGEKHTIAVTAEGGLYTWGTGRAMGHGGDDHTQCLNPTNVTGGGIGEATVVQVSAGSSHSMAITAVREVWTWGDGDEGQLGHGEKEHLAVPRGVEGIEGAVGVAGGVRHSVVSTDDGRVMVFGTGHGSLGLGVAEALAPTVIEGINTGHGDTGTEGKD
jgi:alpha-tubulin suppressor-like RCC1 family protein